MSHPENRYGNTKTWLLSFSVPAVEATANLRGPRIEIWASVCRNLTKCMAGVARRQAGVWFSRWRLDFWGWVNFSAKTLMASAVARPRHKWSRVLTIERFWVLGMVIQLVGVRFFRQRFVI